MRLPIMVIVQISGSQGAVHGDEFPMFVLDLYSAHRVESKRKSLSLHLIEGHNSLIEGFSKNVMMYRGDESVRSHGSTSVLILTTAVETCF
jgi:hypothetical protein